MVEISVHSDLLKFAERMTDLQRRQVPFAAARALNDVTKGAVEDYRQAALEIFDRPVKFTINAAYAVPVKNRRQLTAAVALREWAGKGTAAADYLAPEILGGGRKLKKFEYRLGFSALMPQAMQTIPGRAALIDSHGNMDRKQISQILLHLRALDDIRVRISDRKLRRNKLLTNTAVGRSKYFVAKGKDGKPLGIWSVMGRGQVAPVLFFPRRAPSYTPRFHFSEFFTASYRRRFAPALAARFQAALATARPGGGAAL